MYIDLRSDTVTKPGPEMRRAMFEAEIGDDVFGEDPSVNLLQEKAAELLGKEAALYVPSGTMANQLALKIHLQLGQEVICDQYAHLYRSEGGAGAALSGVSYYPLSGARGLITAEQVAGAIQSEDIHNPETGLIALENTNNRGSGAFFELAGIEEISALAKQNSVPMHLDGARMFHACLAGGYSPKELAANFQTVSFCLSKGLGAPVGSLVVGTAAMIKKAVRFRKQMGGGMRQAGFLAAAGIYALDNNIDRLAEDHANAARLARGLAPMAGLELEADLVQTNIVIFDVAPSGLSTGEAAAKILDQGVGVIPFGPTSLRAVTHLDVPAEAIDSAIEAIGRVLG